MVSSKICWTPCGQCHHYLLPVTEVPPGKQPGFRHPVCPWKNACFIHGDKYTRKCAHSIVTLTFDLWLIAPHLFWYEYSRGQNKRVSTSTDNRVHVWLGVDRMLNSVYDQRESHLDSLMILMFPIWNDCSFNLTILIERIWGFEMIHFTVTAVVRLYFTQYSFVFHFIFVVGGAEGGHNDVTDCMVSIAGSRNWATRTL